MFHTVRNEYSSRNKFTGFGAREVVNLPLTGLVNLYTGFDFKENKKLNILGFLILKNQKMKTIILYKQTNQFITW